MLHFFRVSRRHVCLTPIYILSYTPLHFPPLKEDIVVEGKRIIQSWSWLQLTFQWGDMEDLGLIFSGTVENEARICRFGKKSQESRD